VPPPGAAGYASAVHRIVDRERVDLIVPNADESVAALSKARRRFPGRLFLPRPHVVRLCGDKHALNRFLAHRDIPVPPTLPVARLARIDAIFRRLGPPPLWCRIRTGSNSRGAAPVATPAQARSWIRYWADMRGVPPTDFTLSEYLPGRDFACLMVWRDGTMILAKTCERLSYFFARSQPSGRSSMAGLSKTVADARVVEVCRRAIRALDARASGVFSVDLKEDARGEPRITEINAGRLIAQAILLDRAGKHNLTLTYARLALGEPVSIREEYDAPEDHYFVRNVDAEPLVFHGGELLADILDGRGPLDRTAASRGRPGRPGRADRTISGHRFEITGAVDRHVVEALWLELRGLGRTMGFDVSGFDVSNMERWERRREETRRWA
jgi:carbamoyl-phosphate synthase large subunit